MIGSLKDDCEVILSIVNIQFLQTRVEEIRKAVKSAGNGCPLLQTLPVLLKACNLDLAEE